MYTYELVKLSVQVKAIIVAACLESTIVILSVKVRYTGLLRINENEGQGILIGLDK